MTTIQTRAAFRLAEAMDYLLQEIDAGNEILADQRNEAYCALQDFWAAHPTSALYGAVLYAIEDVRGGGELSGEAFMRLVDAARAFGDAANDGGDRR